MTSVKDNSLKGETDILREQYNSDINVQHLNKLIAAINQTSGDPKEIARLEYLRLQLKDYRCEFHPEIPEL